MIITRRVFITSPRDEPLDTKGREIKGRILQRVRDAKYEPQQFFREGLPKNKAWSFSNVREVMERCCGAVILGLPRWSFQIGSETILMPSEFTHYEGAVAHALRLPVLTIRAAGIPDRAVFSKGGDEAILSMPANADVSWVDGPKFDFRFNAWKEQLEERSDVFLGYCSKGKMAANAIYIFLKVQLNLSVLDWEMDFTGGSSIIEEIEGAALKCAGGIFLFTNDDDKLIGDTVQAAPRDNVVLEAGFFLRAKGRKRVLIIREKGAKMPADLGGTIYAALPDQNSTAMVEGTITKFVKNQL